MNTLLHSDLRPAGWYWKKTPRRDVSQNGRGHYDLVPKVFGQLIDRPGSTLPSFMPFLNELSLPPKPEALHLSEIGRQ
jgi:hypothetical protein